MCVFRGIWVKIKQGLKKIDGIDGPDFVRRGSMMDNIVSFPSMNLDTCMI